MKISHILLLTFLALGAGYLGARLAPGAATTEAKTETAYERVMRTGVLRCGYASWDPILIVDPNTRKVSGIAHDIIEDIAKTLNIKVEWTEETGWGEYVTGLVDGRFDVFCAGPTPNTERARKLIFTDPFVYTKIQLFTQANTTRFDNNPAAINTPQTVIGALDGTTSFKILKSEFPQATFHSYPELIPLSQILVDTAMGKTDVTMQAAFAGALYNASNEKKLRVIPGFEQMRVLENVYMVNRTDYALRELLNEAIAEMMAAGKIGRIIDKYETAPGLFARVAKGYTAP